MSDLKLYFLLLFGILLLCSSVLFFFRYFYKRELRIKNLSTACVEGIVVGYKYSKPAGPPIVEYKVDGRTYQRNLDYHRVILVSVPWKSVQATSRSELLAQKITIYRNSVVSVTRVLEDAFPKGSKMTVWYNPACPKESFVERYSGMEVVYKHQVWICMAALILTPILLTMVFILNAFYK